MSIFSNDKALAMILVTLLCAICLIHLDSQTAKDIVIPAITGIFGIVTGRLSKENNDHDDQA